MNRTLKQLESQGIHILREAYSSFKSLCMLWSIGKDSTVLLWLARKAFAGHVPFPLVHIDTSFKIPEMIAYRDRLAKEWNLDLRYAMNHDALSKQETFPHGRADRLTCCRLLKTVPLRDMLAGTCTRTTGRVSKRCSGIACGQPWRRAVFRWLPRAARCCCDSSDRWPTARRRCA